MMAFKVFEYTSMPESTNRLSITNTQSCTTCTTSSITLSASSVILMPSIALLSFSQREAANKCKMPLLLSRDHSPTGLYACMRTSAQGVVTRTHLLTAEYIGVLLL